VGAIGLRRSRFAVVAVAFGLLLAACKGSSPQGNQSVSASQTFTYDTWSQVMDDGWDPSSDYSNDIIAMSNVYETLTRYNPATKQAEPLLATSWAPSSDATVWTFKLRPDVYFHTGRLMTAQAAAAAIERTIKLGQGAAYIWDAVHSIDTPDSSSLVFHLKYPAPLDLIASADYAAYIFDTKAAGGEDLAKWFNTPHDSGTGPYTVERWNKGQEIEVVLTAFPKYWAGWSGAHYSRVVFRVVPSSTTAAQLLRAGQVSFVQQMNPSLWGSFKDDPNVQLVSSPGWQNLFGQMNTQTGPLSSLAVRQAVAYAIDYPGIVAALRGAAALSSGVVPPGLWGHFDDLPNYTYDPQKAQELLQQAGYGPGGKPLNLSLTYAQGESNEEIVATLIKSNLAKLGVTVDLQGLQWPSQWARAKSSDPSQRQDIFVEYWWPDYADPYSWFISMFHSEPRPFYNLSYYSNPRLDALIDQVESISATDRAKAIEMYREMQLIVLHDAAVLTLFDLNYEYALLKSVGGFTVNPAYPNVVFVYDLSPQAS